MASPDAPRTFPGDPNPPPKAPEAPKTSSAPAATPSSAGTGALPPAATPGVGGGQEKAKGVYSVVQRDDGSRDVVLTDDNGPRRVAVARSPDAEHALNAVATFDKDRGVWDNVPQSVIKSISTGRIGFPEEVARAWEGGEKGVVQAFNMQAWIDGKMTFDEAKAKNEDETVKAQLAPDGQPGFAWNKLGEYAGHALTHKADTLAAVGRYTAIQLAGFSPMGLEVAAQGAKGALKVAGPALAAGAATGTLELPPVAAGVLWLAKAGFVAGAGKTLIQLETGGAAARMAAQGLPEDVIRNNAIWAGSVKGVLWMTAGKFLPAPAKTALLEALADSPAAQKLVANWAVKYGGEVAAAAGMNAAQDKIRQIFNNMAASAANRPDLLIQGEEGLNQILDAAIMGGTIGAVMAAPEAVGGAAKSLGSKTPAGGEGAGPESAAPGQATRQGAKAKSGEQPASESASGSREGKIELVSQTDQEPLDKSVTEHPVFVKAAADAKPFLPKSVKPTDRVGVSQEYVDIVQEHHDYRNEIQTRMIDDKEITPTMKEKMGKQAEKLAALSRLAKIVHDPEKAIPYFENSDKIGSANTLTPPEDPFEAAKKASREKDGIRWELDAERGVEAVLPPLKAGYKRLFRGEGGPPRKDGEFVGGWFSANPADALEYAGEKGHDLSKLKFIDVKESNIQKFGKDATKPNLVRSDGTYVLPGEMAAEARGVTDWNSPKESASNEFVIDKPIKVERKGTDAKTTKAARQEFVGKHNEQVVRINQFADEVRKAVPDLLERQGMFWYKAAGGDIAGLEDALTDPDLERYHEQIRAATKLSHEALAMLAKIDKYYKESGAVSKKLGTIGDVVENYQNRIYEPEKKTDFVKNENAAGLKQTTSHAKQRTFETEFDAAAAGKVFATTDIADAMSIHNEEMSRVNTARKLGDALVKAGLAAWRTVRNIPNGWAQIGKIEKDAPLRGQDGLAILDENGNQVHSRSVLVAPEGVAKGLKAVADPNFVRKVDLLATAQRAQGIVKTFNLALFGWFHHFTFLMNAVNQRQGGALMSLPKMDEAMDRPDFKLGEQHGALHGLMTDKLQANQDILRDLRAKQGGVIDKIVDAPGVKQLVDYADNRGKFLFGKVQRYLKVANYMRDSANWLADHPDATDAEVTAAHRAIASHVNGVYGGLNWEGMGVEKSNLALARLALLAPDWTRSNYEILKQAVSLDNEPDSKASRAHIATALVSGIVLTEGLNKMLTGHTTDKNPRGHKLEVEVSPGVYVNMFRGPIGDIMKFSSMAAESGAGGASRFAQGKLAPFGRTIIGLAANKQYTGQQVYRQNAGPVAGTFDVLKFILGSVSPVPLSVPNLVQYMKNEKPTVTGTTAVLSGVGRFSKPPKEE